ncbi:MAG: SMP-30/gluconolactonase/LRE family protein [Planctomycetota bacterium]
MKHLFLIVVACLTSVAFAESPLPDEPVIETVAEGFRFTEGPAIAPDGSVWFTDIPNNAIHRFDPETGETTQTLADSGAANGLWFLPDGRLIACAGADRRLAIYRVDEAHELRLDAVVRGHFNGPNDVAVLDTGVGAFFTDPDYRNVANPAEFEGVYRIDFRIATRSLPPQHPAKPIVTNLRRPNGIGLSPDQRTVYVADNGTKLIMAYRRDDPTARLNGIGKLFHDVTDLGGPDGMTVDDAGNVYQAIYDGGVVVIAPDGQRLDYVETGPRTTNVAITEDQQTLYVTSDGKLKRMALRPVAER